jgi:hypothetical protein
MSAKPAQVHFCKGCKACVRIAVDLNWDTEPVGIWSNNKVLPSKIHPTREKEEIVSAGEVVGGDSAYPMWEPPIIHVRPRRYTGDYSYTSSDGHCSYIPGGL